MAGRCTGRLDDNKHLTALLLQALLVPEFLLKFFSVVDKGHDFFDFLLIVPRAVLEVCNCILFIVKYFLKFGYLITPLNIHSYNSSAPLLLKSLMKSCLMLS